MLPLICHRLYKRHSPGNAPTVTQLPSHGYQAINVYSLDETQLNETILKEVSVQIELEGYNYVFCG